MFEEQTMEIEKLFVELESLIALCLRDKKVSNEEVMDAFTELMNSINLIDVGEPRNKGVRNHFKYRFYQIRVSYLNSIETKTERQKKLLGQDEQLIKKFKGLPREGEPELEEKFAEAVFAEMVEENRQVSSVPIKGKQTRVIVEKCLSGLKEIVTKGILSTLKEQYEMLENNALTSFDNYQSMISMKSELSCLFADIDNNSIKQPDSACILESTAKLRAIFDALIRKKTFEFVVYFARLAETHPKTLLSLPDNYSNEEVIKEHFKKLFLHFHPDKLLYRKEERTPAEEDAINTLFAVLNEKRNSLLRGFKEVVVGMEYLGFYQKQAEEQWHIAIAYKDAAKGNWHQLNVLKGREVEHLDQAQLLAQKKNHCIFAYNSYRTACKIADAQKNFLQQINFRSDMALCQYLAGNYLEAQLYALSSIKFLLSYSNEVTMGQFKRAHDILKKTQDQIPKEERDFLAAKAVQKSCDLIALPDGAVALKSDPSQYVSVFYSYGTIEKIHRISDEALEEVSRTFMMCADRKLASCETAYLNLLKTTLLGMSIGMNTMALGITRTAIASSTLSKPSLSSVFWGIGISFSLGFGYAVYQKGKQGIQLSKSLNKIIRKALSAYDQNEYQKCLDAFFTPYDKKGNVLLVLKRPDGTVNPDQIIDCLLSCDFRPDGIAYLLNLLGFILYSGKVQVPGIVQRKVRNQAEPLFTATTDAKLETKAKVLDQQINELRKKNTEICCSFNRSFDLFTSIDYIDSIDALITQKNVNDADEMPFLFRLEEMRNFARLNRAIIHSVHSREDEEFIEAKTLIEEVRRSVYTNYQFTSQVNLRLEALDDLLWVLYGHTALPDPLFLEHDAQVVAEPEQPVVDSAYMMFLARKAEEASSTKQKISDLLKLSQAHRAYAEAEQEKDRQKSLQYWDRALTQYWRILALDHNNIAAGLGVTMCLVQLTKYTQFFSFIEENKHLSDESEYWVLRGIVARKKHEYSKAKGFFIEALRINSNNKQAERERALLEKILLRKDRSSQAIVSRYERQKPVLEEQNFTVHRQNESYLYKILSIDGGGVRGIFPALWLSEIEKETKKPAAHLFHMMCGTSTGGVISAGLSVPALEADNTLSPWQPRYSASYLLNLYTARAEHVFTPHAFRLRSDLFQPKYTNGRSDLFREFFGEAKLSDSLVDLVIPATSEEKAYETYLFTKYDALREAHDDCLLIDALMATSAAPTFFSSYEIKNKGIFCDGGVQLNNPAAEGYRLARDWYGKSENNTFMLSMGTGACIPLPLNRDQSRGQLFWAKNLHKVTLAAQESNTHRSMQSVLGTNYQRWQVWLENPLALDDYAPESIQALVDEGRQYIEELYVSDDNAMNRLVETLLKDTPYGDISQQRPAEASPVASTNREYDSSSFFEEDFQENIGPRHIKGWELQDVEARGNCYYDSVVCQLRKMQHPFLNEVPQGTSPRDSLRLRIQGKEFKDGEWVDHNEIIKVAQEFSCVIAIVDTRYPDNKFLYHYMNHAGEYDYTNNPRLLPKEQAVIQLAFTGDHYLSVTSIPKAYASAAYQVAVRGFLSPRQRGLSRDSSAVEDEKDEGKNPVNLNNLSLEFF